MNFILQLYNLSVKYRNKDLPTIENLNLSVRKGSILVIVGESGSGKSTLIRSVIGLLPTGGEIISGQLLFQDKDITKLPYAQARELRGKQIAMIFQDPRAALNPRRKIGSQFVEVLRSHASISFKEARNIALSALADVRMPDPTRVMDSYAFELSGGMCQRVAFAMAISEYIQPSLLLADEPTSALDVMIRAQVVRQILWYRENFGVSIIMVTHDFNIAAFLADQIAVMRDGRLIEWGDRDQIINAPNSEYTKKLLSAAPKMEM